MRTSSWTPSIVPDRADQTVYLVENDFGGLGRSFVQTDCEHADLETTITALLEGQYKNPVVAFNTAERWSEDVSEDIAHELRRRCDLQLRDVPSPIRLRRRARGSSSPVGLADGLTVAFLRKKSPAVGTKGPFPGFIEPALATPIEKVPGGERWLHEIKFDGYRVQVHVVNEAAKVFTRRGHDWTNRFRKIADDAWHVAARSAIIDGEVVVPAADGSTDFSILQNELKGRSTKIALVAFDLLYLDGQDLRKLPLVERKAQLKRIIQHTEIQFSDSFEIDGAKVFAHACKIGLEGVVSKVRDSSYVSGRGNNWVKKTCAQRETLTIAGFALDGKDWDGIYLGRRKGGDLVYAGKVDHGFDKQSAADLRKRLTPLIRKTQPYNKRIAHKGIWVEPQLMAEIEYRAKSAEGKVRHPFFKGIREDA